MNWKIAAAFGLLLVACSCQSHTVSTPQISWQSFPQRTYQDWDPEKATDEAEADIKAGSIKIYWAGTIAATPAGVATEDLPLIKHLPGADGGIGCEIDETRARMFRYSLRYNQIIIEHLRKTGVQQARGAERRTSSGVSAATQKTTLSAEPAGELVSP